MSTRFPSDAEHPGVQVIDVSNPRRPKRAGTLTDPAMLGTWESLKVNRRRGPRRQLGRGPVHEEQGG